MKFDTVYSRRMSPPGRLSALVAAILLTGCAVLGVTAPRALAQACPDVQVVFARGTGEAPGVGGIGQGFVDALQAKTGTKS
ncbi:MAG: cutinase, partial [Mycobacterium sp.]|nr:cutinase [Mycobacterium sp.]